MIAELTLEDADQGRTYTLQVNFRCRPEIGAAPGWIVDINSVYLESCVIWFDKQGSEVEFDLDERALAARFVERKYQKEIEVLCLEAYEREQQAA